MVKLLEFLDRHTARHLFRSSHLKAILINFVFCIYSKIGPDAKMGLMFTSR